MVSCTKLPKLDRRAFLHAGALGMGLGLPELLFREAKSAEFRRNAPQNSVILLWMRGGPSQHDLWDPKPDAQVEYRGEFSSISTTIPGIRLCEYAPLAAARMNQWAIVRSLAHRNEDGNVGHSDGDQICFTGYRAGPMPDVNVMPSCGAWTARFLSDLDPGMPAYVMIPRLLPGAGHAWLGPQSRAYETLADPAENRPFVVPNLGLSLGNAKSLGERTYLLGALDLPVSTAIPKPSGLGEAGEGLARYQKKALDLLTGDRARMAFDLAREPIKVRERYGMMPAFDPKDVQRCGAPNWAQRMLLARRLVEAGVRLVTVDCRWWDFHKQGFDSQKRGFLPRWDLAYTALLDDLKDRGLLDSTLVVAWGEIGRTPRVNEQAGRDHWPHALSAAFAGGGVIGGRVVGSTDAKGTAPKDLPKIPHDVLATIYRHLGIDTAHQETAPTGRPFPVLPLGKPIEELFV